MLQVGDWVCCGGLGLFPAITRAVTGGGLRAIRDRSISTHTGILFAIGKQLLVAEMCAQGIEVNSLEVKYRRWNERVLCFRRPRVRDEMEYHAAVQDGIGELVRRGMEYDYKGLLEFVTRRVKDSRSRMYCSELVYTFSADHMREPFPADYDRCVSPEQLHTCVQAETICKC